MEEIIVKTGDQTICETGMGVPDPASLRLPDERRERVIRLVAANALDWPTLVRAKGAAGVGVGATGQAASRDGAIRLARAAALHAAAQHLLGLRLDPDTAVKDLVRRDDKFKTRWVALLQGARAVERPGPKEAAGDIEAAVEIDAGPVLNAAINCLREAPAGTPETAPASRPGPGTARALEPGM